MLLVALFGSPRKVGNTDLMAEAFLEGASAASDGLRIERIFVRDLQISGCLGCGFCDGDGICIQRDDMDKVLPLLASADRVVMASPIYFYGLTGQLKLLVDRSQASFMGRELKRKESGPGTNALSARKGFFLSAGATRGKRLFECAVLTARYFFDALDIAFSGYLCFREIDGKGDILRHPTALDECRKAGREFVGGAKTAA